MLKKEEIHFFNDIAYYHVPFTHCPTGDDLRTKLKCHCNPKDNFDWKGYSCELSIGRVHNGSLILLKALRDTLNLITYRNQKVTSKSSKRKLWCTLFEYLVKDNA